MKKYLLLIPFLLLGIGCSEKENVPDTPVLRVDISEIEADKVIVNYSSAESDELFYLCQKSDEKSPVEAEIVNNGEKIAKEGRLELKELKCNTEYTLYIAARNYYKVTLCKTSFKTNKKYVDDIDFKYASAAYYGDQVEDGNGYFILTLSDKEATDDGQPTTTPQYVINLMIDGKQFNMGDDFSLTPGKYTLSDGYGKNTVNAQNSKYFIAVKKNDKGNILGYKLDYREGLVEIKNEGSKYTIDVDMVVNNDSLNYIKGKYNGEITFYDKDPSHYKAIDYDLDFQPTQMSGNFTTSPTMGVYNISMFNTPVNEGGFVSGAGHLLNLAIIVEPSQHMDPSKLNGVFTVMPFSEAENITPGHIYGGVYQKVYGMYMPMGSYLYEFDDKARMASLGLVNSGKVTIKTTEDNKINIKADLKTIDTGSSITVDFTGDVNSISDYTQL